MSREKEGYRDTLAQLNEAFPDQGALSRAEVARVLGVSRQTVARRIKFSAATGRVTKADFARQICV